MAEIETRAPAELLTGFAVLPTPALVVDAGLRLRRLNHALLAATGFDAAALAGEPAARLFDVTEDERAALEAALAADGPAPVAFRLKGGGGSPLWVVPSSSPLPESAVGFPGLRLVLLHDVSSRRAAEEAARQNALISAALDEALRLVRSSLPPSAALAEMAERLVSLLGAAAILIGRRARGARRLEHLAAAGPARDFVRGLSISDDANRLEGQGVIGAVLREGGSARLHYEDPDFAGRAEFAPFLARTRRFGITSVVAAAADTQEGERVVFAAGFSTKGALEALPPALPGRLAESIVAYFDRLALARHQAGIEALRRARRRVAEQLLRTESEEETFTTLAQALAEEMPGVSVDVLAPREGRLARLATAGPLASVIDALPEPPADEPPPDQPLQLPTEIWLTRCPLVIDAPARRRRAQPAWAEPPLCEVGRLMGWPIIRPGTDEAFGVLVLFLEAGMELSAEQAEIVASIVDNAAQGLARLRERQMIAALARLDPLTGLLNRRAWQERLGQALAEAHRRGDGVALGLLDLDDFKSVNDRFGHAAGDKVLAELAARLRGAMREADILARLGGDEFALAFTLIEDRTELDAVLARLAEVLAPPYDLPGGAALSIGASLGLALYPEHGVTAEDLLARADAVLYEAKNRRHHGLAVEFWRAAEEAAPSLPPSPTSLSAPSLAYGAEAAALLTRARPLFRRLRGRFVDAFYAELTREGESAVILARLSEAELDRLRFNQGKHLDALLDPLLDAETHAARARAVGRVHALVGVPPAALLGAFRVYERMLREALPALDLPRGERRRLLDIILERILNEFAAQREGEAEVAAAWQKAPARIAAALEGCSGSTTCSRLTEAALTLPGVIGATLNRPDEEGRFVYEYTSGVADAYAQLFAERDLWPRLFPETDPRAQGVTGRAWRERRIATAATYHADPRQSVWQEAGTAFGIRSAAAIPIRNVDGAMRAVLVLFGAYPGLFDTAPAWAALEGLSAVLHLVCARLPALPSPLLAAPVRLGLRQSLGEGRLEFHFQPFFALQRDGQIVGAEALARLRAADGRLLSPGQFLPAFGVEELRHVFIEGVYQTLAALARWEREGLRLGAASLNLPPELLEAADLAPLVGRALAEFNLTPERLVFELLEHGVRGGLSAELPLLQGLIALGCPLAIDDLGAGESHLDRLSRLPFQGLKIDRGLTARAAGEASGMMLVGSLLMLARGLGVLAAVEGLETVDEVEMAVELGAALGQGFALARPMPAAEMVGFARSFVFPVKRGVPRTPLGAAARNWRHHFEHRHNERSLRYRIWEAPAEP